MNKIVLAGCVPILIVAWIGFPSIIKCPYKTVTGVPCLFCGTLTSLGFIVHGNIKMAWMSNPVGVFLLAGLVLTCILCAIKEIRKFYD